MPRLLAQEIEQKVRDEVERRVAEKTAELSRDNARLKEQLAELKLAEESARKSEERYRLLTEKIGIGFWHVTPQGHTLYINPPMCVMLEIESPEELVGQTYHGFFTPESVARIEQENLNAREKGLTSSYELKLVGKRGTHRDVMLTGVPELGENGRLESMLGTFIDITERKRAEEKLAASEAELKALLAAMTDYIFVMDRQGRYMRVIQTNAPQLYRPEIDRLGQRFHDVFSAQQADTFVASIQRALTLSQPLTIEYSLTENDITTHYITTISPMSENLVLWVARDISEHKQAEEKLTASEAELRALIAAMTDIIFVIDGQGRYLRVVETKSRPMYLPTSQLIGRTLHELFPSAQADTFLGYVRQTLESGRTVNVEYNLPIDGKETYFVGAMSPLLENSVLLVSHNITERKIAEEALRKSEELYRTLANNFPNGSVFLFDQNLRYTVVGGTGLEVIGLSQAVFEGQTAGNVITELHEPLKSYYQKALTGISSRFEAVLANRMFDIQIIPVKNEQSEIFAGMLVAQDITERKQAEEALRISETKFRNLFAFNPLPIWVVDMETLKILDVNQAAIARYGYSREEFLQMSLPDLRQPDERDQFLAFLAEQRPPYANYARHRVKSGELIDVAARMDILEFAGQQIGIAVVEDITERKRMEQALQASHDQLEQRVIKRTAELSTLNNVLEQEVTERKQAQVAEHEQRALAEALRDTAAVLNSTLNFEEILNRILINVERVLHHDESNIMLIERGIARIVRWRGYTERGLEEVALGLRLVIADTPNLRQMVETRQPIVIPDVDKFPEWIKVPGSEWIHSYAGVPISLGNEVIGFIELDSATPKFFTDEHAERLQAFAHQAATAIQNARRYEEAHTLAAFQERQRLARELHDAVSQTLFSASVIAESLPRLLERNPDKAQHGLVQLRQLTRGALAEMRTLLLELRPAGLVETELSDLLRQLTEAIAGRTEMSIALNVQGQGRLPADVQIALYRIAQESFNNVVRHAQATQLSIDLVNNPNGIELTINDNGRGFDQAAVPSDHFGLSIMRERADSIGAILKIDSKINMGTYIRVVWNTH